MEKLLKCGVFLQIPNLDESENSSSEDEEGYFDAEGFLTTVLTEAAKVKYVLARCHHVEPDSLEVHRALLFAVSRADVALIDVLFEKGLAKNLSIIDDP